MGRILTFLGVLLIVGGIIGGVVSIVLPLFNTGAGALVFDPEAVKGLCNSGERVVEETGASEYVEGQGYRSAALIYCEDDTGNRRLVTGDFARAALGSVPGFIGSTLASVGLSSVFFGAMGLGVIMLIVGGIINRSKNAPASSFGYGTAPIVVNVQGAQSASALADPIFAPVMETLYSKTAPTNARLQALEVAYQAERITPDQYARMKDWLTNGDAKAASISVDRRQ